MRPNRKQLELNTAAAATYHSMLAGSPGEAYLEGRGLMAGAEQFQLGWVERPVVGHEDWFVHCISIPYITRAGVVGMKFRRIDDSGQKYAQMQGQKQHLFNVDAIINAVREVLVVEGELDAIAATLAGHPACGVAGVSNWKPLWRRVFDGIEVVKIVTDNDEKDDGSNPGQDLARRVSDALANGVRVSLPPGEDVNSTIQKYGAQSFTELVGAI